MGEQRELGEMREQRKLGKLEEHIPNYLFPNN
jgi:hypothetical protein